MRAAEFIVESKSADLYKGATLDRAEAILASNTMLGGPFNDIGNRPQPELSQSKDDTWAWRRRGAERYLRPSSNIELNWDTSPEEFEQWKKDIERAGKRFPEKRFPSGDYSVSLTRDKRIAYNFTGVDGGVIFVLDQELLARDLGRRLHPYTDIWHTGQQRKHGNESEESVIGGIPNVKKYIKRIELVGDEFDPTKYPNLAQYIGYYDRTNRLNEFAPEGFDQYSLYTGDGVSSHLIDKFSSLQAAKEEVEFIWDTDPETRLVVWFIKNLNDETVWYYDPQEIADVPRLQFKKSDDLEEMAGLVSQGNMRK